MDLTDVLVSLDALHAQVDTAKHIVAAGVDYLMTVKKNQKVPVHLGEITGLAHGAHHQ